MNDHNPTRQERPGPALARWTAWIREHRLALILCVALLALIIIWGALSEGTFDDDCPTRYFKVKKAWHSAEEFISVWNRPLFVLLYVLPVHFLGKSAIIVETGLISVLTCLVGYLLARARGMDQAVLMVPFIAFQTLFFALSFSALTEPLAALLLALGLYFHQTRRPLAFAIVGGLLPLARLELSILLVFWAVALWRRGAWRYIPILAAPTLLWNLGAWAVEGDPIWLVNRVFSGEGNRYDPSPWHHYPVRYIWVIGPAAFYLVLVGLLERLIRRRFDLNVGLFLAGFCLYAIFSWKLSLGNPAGFLRNLVPLTPMVAVLALEGYNLWMGPDRRRGVVVRLLVYSIAIVTVTLLFLSWKLHLTLIINRQAPEHLKLVIVSIMMAVLLLKMVAREGLMKTTGWRVGVATLVVASMAGYTLVREPPIGLDEERAIMKDVAEYYKRNGLGTRKTYVNHIWFFYAGDFDRWSDNFGLLTRANMAAAPPGSIFIWEGHYSHRLAGDVLPEHMFGNPEFREVRRWQAQRRRFGASVLVKLEPPHGRAQPGEERN